MAWESKIKILGLPLISLGLFPRGIIAIGWISKGFFAIGQLSTGVICFGQVAIGIINVGQLGLGIASLGQAAVGLLFASGGAALGFITLAVESAGYYNVRISNNFFSSLDIALQQLTILGKMIRANPYPLLMWLASWTTLFSFLYIQRDKLRINMTLLDLFRKKFRHSNTEVRIEAIKELDDENTIKEIAVRDKDKNVRAIALAHISDQQFIADRVFKDRAKHVKFAAIEALTDQKLLAAISTSSLGVKFAEKAARKLTEKDFQKKIITGDFHSQIKIAAISVIQDQDLLAEFAANRFFFPDLLKK